MAYTYFFKYLDRVTLLDKYVLIVGIFQYDPIILFKTTSQELTLNKIIYLGTKGVYNYSFKYLI